MNAQVGMLWFDNTPGRVVSEKLVGAVNYMEKKYRVQPVLCFVHPVDYPEGKQGDRPEKVMVYGVEVRSSGMVLPNHLWLLMPESTPEKKATAKASLPTQTMVMAEDDLQLTLNFDEE